MSFCFMISTAGKCVMPHAQEAENYMWVQMITGAPICGAPPLPYPVPYTGIGASVQSSSSALAYLVAGPILAAVTAELADVI